VRGTVLASSRRTPTPACRARLERVAVRSSTASAGVPRKNTPDYCKGSYDPYCAKLSWRSDMPVDMYSHTG
jgi:hypothetical protein